MSNFRDFLFNRDRQSPYALAVAMMGVRMGERLLLVGDDARLFAQLAGKVGLTGRSIVVVGSGSRGGQCRGGSRVRRRLAGRDSAGRAAGPAGRRWRVRRGRRRRGADAAHRPRPPPADRVGPVGEPRAEAKRAARDRRGPAEDHVRPGGRTPRRASTPSGPKAAPRNCSSRPGSTRSASSPTGTASGSRRDCVASARLRLAVGETLMAALKGCPTGEQIGPPQGASHGRARKPGSAFSLQPSAIGRQK